MSKRRKVVLLFPRSTQPLLPSPPPPEKAADAAIRCARALKPNPPLWSANALATSRHRRARSKANTSTPPLWSARESARSRSKANTSTPHFGRRTHWPPPSPVYVCVGRSASATHTHTKHSQPHMHTHTERDERERDVKVPARGLKKARHNAERLRTRQLSSGAATPKRAPRLSQGATYTHTNIRLVEPKKKNSKTSARLSAKW